MYLLKEAESLRRGEVKASVVDPRIVGVGAAYRLTSRWHRHSWNKAKPNSSCTKSSTSNVWGLLGILCSPLKGLGPVSGSALCSTHSLTQVSRRKWLYSTVPDPLGGRPMVLEPPECWALLLKLAPVAYPGLSSGTPTLHIHSLTCSSPALHVFKTGLPGVGGSYFTTKFGCQQEAQL